MIMGITISHIKLAKEFLASRNDNTDYLQALEDLSGLLLVQLEENMEVLLDE